MGLYKCTCTFCNKFTTAVVTPDGLGKCSECLQQGRMACYFSACCGHHHDFLIHKLPPSDTAGIRSWTVFSLALLLFLLTLVMLLNLR